MVVCMCVCSVTQSRLTHCNTMDCSPPGSSVRGISQARVVEWVAISCSRGSSRPRDRTYVSCIDGWILYHCATWEDLIRWLEKESRKWSRSVVSDSLRPHGLHGLPGSSVHGIFQARVLEWVAISMETNVPDFQPGEKISTKGRVRGGWESFVKTQGQTLSNRFVNALPEAISLWLDVNVLSINTTYTDKTAFSLAFDLLDL